MYERRSKRVLDFIIAAAGLVVLFPLLLVIAIVVLLDVGWPILFVQEREGRSGERFRLLKFRSMHDLRGSGGRPLPDSARITRIGRLLRSSSVDELPGLVNVIRGDLSLVGPRPLPVGYSDHYTVTQRERLRVKPGMTGWAAVNGRNGQSWERIFEHDVWYADNISLVLDLRIIIRTVWIVLKRRGIERGDCDYGSRFAEALRSRAAEEPVRPGVVRK
jgi:sugar transferase EpsL